MIIDPRPSVCRLRRFDLLRRYSPRVQIRPVGGGGGGGGGFKASLTTGPLSPILKRCWINFYESLDKTRKDEG